MAVQKVLQIHGQDRMQHPTVLGGVAGAAWRLPPWTGSWTGSVRNPSAGSAICAMAGGIGAASGSAAGEQAPRNASLRVSQVGEPGYCRVPVFSDQGAAAGTPATGLSAGVPRPAWARCNHAGRPDQLSLSCRKPDAVRRLRRFRLSSSRLRRSGPSCSVSKLLD
jgi:hypothetical protein